MLRNSRLATMAVVKTRNVGYCKNKSRILGLEVLREKLETSYSFKNSSSNHNGENGGMNSWD